MSRTIKVSAAPVTRPALTSVTQYKAEMQVRVQRRSVGSAADVIRLPSERTPGAMTPGASGAILFMVVSKRPNRLHPGGTPRRMLQMQLLRSVQPTEPKSVAPRCG